jgi:hypothetical protein
VIVIVIRDFNVKVSGTFVIALRPQLQLHQQLLCAIFSIIKDPQFKTLFCG